MSEQIPGNTLSEESADWLSMEDFSAGIDANRIAPSDDLAGRSLVIRGADGALSLVFGESGTVTWNAENFAWAGSGTDTYEAVPVGDGAYWIDFSLGERQVETLTVAVHPERGWALIVHSRIHDDGADVETRVMRRAHWSRPMSHPWRRIECQIFLAP
jgi:hypothetical protein